MNEASVVAAFLDASVLYPSLLRNILRRLALYGLFRARWSARVHDEWTDALLRNRPDIPRDRVERTRLLMEFHLPDALVEGYEHRVEGLTLPDADDRHVLAVALEGEARTIVTANLRDFPDAALAGLKLEVMHPDTFILGLIENDQSQVAAALRRLRLSYKNPPQSVAEILFAMTHHGLTASADALKACGENL